MTLLFKREVTVLILLSRGPALAKRAYMDLRKLACILAKYVNLTSSLITAPIEEMTDIKTKVIQYHVAIDQLLRTVQDCESFKVLAV